MLGEAYPTFTMFNNAMGGAYGSFSSVEMYGKTKKRLKSLSQDEDSDWSTVKTKVLACREKIQGIIENFQDVVETIGHSDNCPEIERPTRLILSNFNTIVNGKIQGNMYGRNSWIEIACMETAGLCHFLLEYAKARALNATNKESLSRYENGRLTYACYFRYFTGVKFIASFPTAIALSDIDEIAKVKGLGSHVCDAIRRFVVGNDISVWGYEQEQGDISLLNEEELELLNLDE
jgi:hypothetical protein